jgi:hypothetical protein
MYNVKVLLDSVSEAGARLTSFQLEYPRFIHSALMTYRMFSRGAASSRAIPISKMIQRVIDDPAIPLSWGSNQRGMTAGPELVGVLASGCRARWLEGRDAAVRVARDLETFGVHKQLVNRVLEPYMFITTILTAQPGSLAHMFEERAHEAAQPEFQWLAVEMRRQLTNSRPTMRLAGEWHMPFLGIDDHALALETKRKISTARCARVSLLGHDGVRDIARDLDLAARLATETPPHLSPFEHVATPGAGTGNFRGWNQYRHEIEEHRRSST